MITKYENELSQLKGYAGANAKKCPLKWIKWETSYTSPTGAHTPIWRELDGDIGDIIASTHDKGIVIILVKKDGICYQIKNYKVGQKANEELTYEKEGPECKSLTEALSEFSPHFKEIMEEIKEDHISESDQPVVSREIVQNDLVTLPQPVLVLKQPTDVTAEELQQKEEPEDDEKVVPFSKPSSTEGEYWSLHAKLKQLGNPESTDPARNDLKELSENKIFEEATGQRAIYSTGSIPKLRDMLRTKQIYQLQDQRTQQQYYILTIFSMITNNALIRRQFANEDNIKLFLELLKREEVLLPPLLRTIANCCHNTNFRNLFIHHQGIENLIGFLRNQGPLISSVCYTLWSVNRSTEATKIMIESHLMIELERYTNPPTVNDEQMCNITRLICSLPQYGPKIFEPLKPYHIKFFCQGLRSTEEETMIWSAKAFTCYPIEEDLQKLFCSRSLEGPSHLMALLDNESDDVVLSGLDCIVVLGEIRVIRDAFMPAIKAKISKLWNSENPDVIKGVLNVLGVLTKNNDLLTWTQSQNMIPDLIKYLDSQDPEFVIYSAKAIGSCCNNTANLKKLMELNGIRTLWSLMKSPYTGVQAAATKALVPFLRSPGSPTIVRTFVDGLDLLVSLLRSDDPLVQEAACMAVTEVAKDKENLAFMTDLGLVELLSRLLSTKLDSVRKPLADAIGVSAVYGNNRRRFGEEGAVDPLVSYLTPPSTNIEVHAATAKALKALSEDKQNSKKLSQAGVVQFLLIMVESDDQELKMAAAVAIRNIRTNRC